MIQQWLLWFPPLLLLCLRIFHARAADVALPLSVRKLWHTPVFTRQLFQDSERRSHILSELTKAAAWLEHNEASVSKSNVGGFQSEVFDSEELRRDSTLSALEEALLSAATEFVEAGFTPDVGGRLEMWQSGELALEVASLWINVNRHNDYNVQHTHADCFASGVFYVSASAAALVLVDPRVQAFTSYLQAGWYGIQRNEIIDPEPGVLVLWPCWLAHRVEPSEELDEARISVSFNLRVRERRAPEPLKKTESCAASSPDEPGAPA